MCAIAVTMSLSMPKECFQVLAITRAIDGSVARFHEVVATISTYKEESRSKLEWAYIMATQFEYVGKKKNIRVVLQMEEGEL